MLRLFNLVLALGTLTAAGVLYAIKTDTRRLEASVTSRERELERIEAEIAHLTAERAHLSRPERLLPHAQALGLVPLRGDMLIALPSQEDQARLKP